MNLLPQGNFRDPGVNARWAEGFNIPIDGDRMLAWHGSDITTSGVSPDSHALLMRLCRRAWKSAFGPSASLVRNACGLQIDLYHLSRLPLFQKRKQWVAVVQVADLLPDKWNEIRVQRERILLAMLAVTSLHDDE